MTEDRSDPERSQGIEFDGLNEKLAGMDFPVTTEELVEEHGDHTIGHQRGSETLEDVLGPRSGEEFESRDEVRQALVATVGDDAIGRKEYADRDPPTDAEGDRDEKRTL